MLQAGDVLLVYPEGTRQNGPKIQPLQPGAAYLALRAGVPIVPVGIAGTEEIMRSHGRRGIHASDGSRSWSATRSMPPPVTTGVVRRERVDALTDHLHEELQRVFDEATRVRNA